MTVYLVCCTLETNTKCWMQTIIEKYIFKNSSSLQKKKGKEHEDENPKSRLNKIWS